MIKTISEMMERVNCPKWPEVWEQYFPEAQKQYEEEGCIYAYPQYYEMLYKKYDIIRELMPVYQQAANLVKGDEAFELFLVFLCVVLNKSDNLWVELGEFVQPRSPEDKNDMKYDMLTGLAICSQADINYKNLLKKGLPEKYIPDAMNVQTNGIRAFGLRFDGAYGYDRLRWFQLAIQGKLIPLSVLQIELDKAFYGDAMVFQNDKGEVIALSHNQQLHKSGRVLGMKHFEDNEGAWSTTVEETETAYIGHPFDELGIVQGEKVSLNKNEWKLAFKKGDSVVGLHIPAKTSLKDEDLDEFFALAREVLEKMNYEYKAFVVCSWLIDAQLKSLLGEKSKIVGFLERFGKIGIQSLGTNVLTFAFNQRRTDVDIETLPEDTSLQRNIKQHYREGKAIYDVIGYIIK